jgi:Gluconate 2-dehydrogenase subunit 3
MRIPDGRQHEHLDSDLTRRAFVAGAGAMGLLALAPPARVRGLLAAAPALGQPGHFLTAHELEVLGALADRLIPGPPEDPTPGALEAGVPHAIDLLLGAFELEPPLIHAGGPFSDRAGSRHDDMAHFVPMDRQAELAWRIRLEGSRGIREREFAGPVVGLQQLYRDGLAHLDQRSQTSYRANFAEATSAQRDAILADRSDAGLQRFVGAALANTLEAMYGPPEYGGNRDLVGWSSNGWAGDSQPRGFSRARVTEPDRASSAPAHDGLLNIHGLPDLSGRPASRDEWWLRRGRLGRQ